MTIAEKPFPIKWRGFSPLFSALTHARILINSRYISLHRNTSNQESHFLTKGILFRHLSIVAVLSFSPVHLQSKKSRLVSFYAFIIWWLLPSLHSNCLRFFTSFVTLNLKLGTLTMVWVVPLSTSELTPRCLTPELKEKWIFRV